MSRDPDNVFSDEGVALIRPESRLPADMEPVAVMDMVRRYVETERARSRRIVVWTSTVFLFVVLVVLTLFISVGIYVVRNSRETTELVDRVQMESREVAAQTAGVANRVEELEDESRSLIAAVEDSEDTRQEESQMFKIDLERFGKWVTARNARRDRSLDGLDTRVQRMESLLDLREKELAELQRKYAAALVRSGAVSPPAGGDSAPPGVDGVLVEPEWVSQKARPRDLRPVGEADADLAVAASPAAGELDRVQALALPNGDRYEGQVRNGLLDGWGVYYYRNGDRYEGNFRDDVKQGYGVLYFHNGDVYKGDFQNDVRHGRGTYVFANGARYIGDFRNGQRHGRGRYIYEGGQEYIGEFRDGKIDGPGFSVFPGHRDGVSAPPIVSAAGQF